MLIHQIKLLYQVHLIRASSYGGGLQMSKVYCDLLCYLQLLCSFSENVCKGPPKHWEKLAGSFSTVGISRPCSVAQILNGIIIAYVPYLKTGQNHSQCALEERNLDLFQGRKIKNLGMSLGHELGKNFSKFCIDFLHQQANFQFLFKCLEISLLELWCA